VERLIGTIRIHRSLNKDAPISRAIERLCVVTHPSLSLAAFVTNIAESDFRYTQERIPFIRKINALAAIPSDEKRG
jgi:hypothetical protein